MFLGAKLQHTTCNSVAKLTLEGVAHSHHHLMAVVADVCSLWRISYYFIIEFEIQAWLERMECAFRCRVLVSQIEIPGVALEA